MAKIRYNIYIERKQLEQLSREAIRLQISVAELVRRFIDQGMEETRRHLSK
jgi:hypothetical protein